MKRLAMLVFLFAAIAGISEAQCPANPPLQLCNATLVSSSSPGSPLATTVGLPGANPQLPPAAINGIITDTAFSATGVRILRVTGPGFDNRNNGAGTNISFAGPSDSHYLDWSMDDSTFMIQDQSSTTYVMALDKVNFQASKIPFSFDATTGKIGQAGNCHATSSDGSGQKYLIFNTGAAPYSNISGVSNVPYSYTTANQFYGFEYSDAGGVKVYKIDISPTIANAATPPTVLNSGNPAVDPFASCLPAGTSTAIGGQSMKTDLADVWIDGRIGISLGSTFAFYYNQSTRHCYTFADSFTTYTDKVSPTAMVFYHSDGTTPWGASPTATDGMHSSEISQDGTYGLMIQPNTWDNDGTHCNASCIFIWQIGTNKVIMPDREDGHGSVGGTFFTKLRATSGGQEDIDSFPLATPSLANRAILVTFVASAQDGHMDANPMTGAQTQYECGTTYTPGAFGASPDGTETISTPLSEEIYCYNQAGVLWRIAHTHTGNKSGIFFSGGQSYTNLSRTGRYMVYGSEWNGLLKDNTGATCTTWAICRTDAFVVELAGAASPLLAQTGDVCQTVFPLIENPITASPSCSQTGLTWAGGQSAGGSLWGNVQTTAGFAFGVSEPTQFGDPTAILTGTWNPNQAVQAIVKINTTPTGACCHEIELRLRMTINPVAHTITGYEGYCSAMPSNPYCHIARWNGANGSYCNLEGASPSINWVNGDVAAATATGVNPTVVTLYRNGVQILQISDTGANCSPGGAAGPWTSGNPGIGFYDNQDNNWSFFGLSSFIAVDATGKIVYALSPNRADVANAVTAMGATVGSTILIPPGTSTPWLSNLSVFLPDKSMLIGSGSQCMTEACKGGNDVTVIVDNAAGAGCSPDPGALGAGGAANSTVRISGFTIRGTPGNPSCNGSFRITGNSQNFRMDHMHFHSQLGQNRMVDINGCVYGVADHNLFNLTGTINGFGEGNASCGALQNGDFVWSQPTQFGTANFFFLEDNTNDDGILEDCRGAGGCRMVIRHNVENETTGNGGGYQNHATGSAGRTRGGRAIEVYQNTHNAPVGTPMFDCMFFDSGTGMIWGNVCNHSQRDVHFVNDRCGDVIGPCNPADPVNYEQPVTPNGWGECGTNSTGIGSNWDQNSVVATGYRCMDQPGSGRGDLLSGNFPNVGNTALGNVIAYPREALEPVYIWNESGAGMPTVPNNFIDMNDSTIGQDRDVYLQCGTNISTCPGPFNGTHGVGSGLLSARPATCTAGPGGNTNGVGYWETDHNQLDVCNPTNIWTAYYTPYTYPHPLVLGGGGGGGGGGGTAQNGSCT